jgi:hypothetical protein
MREAAVRSGESPERDAGTPQIAPHDRADHRSLEGPRGIGKGQEHPTVLMMRAGVPKILGQRGADLLGQRQHPLATAFSAAQSELPCMPIQIVKLEGGDLAGAQPQTGQQREDRPITIRRRTGLGRTLQQPCECSEERCVGRLACRARRILGMARSSPLGATPRQARNRRNERVALAGAVRPCPLL